jgi:hypothetical protein
LDPRRGQMDLSEKNSLKTSRSNQRFDVFASSAYNHKVDI